MATETVQMKVSGMMCSFCTMSIERALKRYPAIKNVLVNLVHGIVLVEADTQQMSRAELAAAVEKLGYTVSATEVQQYATDEALHTLIKRRGIIGMTLAIIDVLVHPANAFGLLAQVRALFSLAVAAFVLLWVGYPILRKTLMALSQRVINANVLLSTGAWGALIVGTLSLFDPRWPNFLPVAAWLMALHLFFGYFKLDTRKKAAEAVRKLLSLQPLRARVLRGHQPVEVLTSEVVVGETLVVRPGERIPLDGEVLEGIASVDESSFTGESVPVTKTIRDPVIGGTLNLDGALQVRVTKVGHESFLSQIVRLMTQIAERKPSIELMTDWLMNFYGPVVFSVATLAFVSWALITGNALQPTVVLLTTIIMGYPCALGITTPMLAAIAGGKGIAIGLLVKASEVFYGLSTVDTVVFDKTGTLTYGRPTVTDVVPFGAARVEVLAWAGAVEGPSEHPLGQAISFYAQREGAKQVGIEGFRASPGKGVSAAVEGVEVVAGKPSFVGERGVRLPEEVRATIEAFASAGKTVVVVDRGGAPWASWRCRIRRGGVPNR
jgi:P-type E1-E2 ATPase